MNGGQQASAPRREASTSADLVKMLLRPDAYPEPTESVECVETHISWVFLTDRYAYKLKKPVRFDFLNFSTPELRRQACVAEVMLNCRLAPGTYLGVIPVGVSPRGKPRLGANCDPVDHLVKMRRLPADATLAKLVEEGRLRDAQVDGLAKYLSRFYQSLPPVTLHVDQFRQSIEAHVMRNFESLLAASQLDSDVVRRVHESQLRVLRLAPDLLDNRVRDARIVDGHGDLRPEHIYFTPAPTVIDCIEFNTEFRTNDVIDELAFLAMECDMIGATEVGDAVFARYMATSGDDPPRVLRPFYQCYRACVRAKVATLRARQVESDEGVRLLRSAADYLRLADRYATQLGRPFCVIVRGLPGTGKSTLSETVAMRLGVELLQTDVLRRELFEANAERPGYNQGRYTPANRQRVYDEMLGRAEAILSCGASVVLDGTFLDAALRERAVEVARDGQANVLIVHCHCPEEVALDRIRARTAESFSETRPEFYQQQREREESDDSGVPSIQLDTAHPTLDTEQLLEARLRELCLPEAVASLAGA